MEGEYDVDNKGLMASIVDMVGHNLGQRIRFTVNTFDQMDKKCIGLPIKEALKGKLGRGENKIVTVLVNSSITTMDQLNTMVMLGALSVIPQIGPKTIELLEKVLVEGNYIVEIGNRKQIERFTSSENGGNPPLSKPLVFFK